MLSRLCPHVIVAFTSLAPNVDAVCNFCVATTHGLFMCVITSLRIITSDTISNTACCIVPRFVKARRCAVLIPALQHLHGVMQAQCLCGTGRVSPITKAAALYTQFTVPGTVPVALATQIQQAAGSLQCYCVMQRAAQVRP